VTRLQAWRHGFDSR